MGELTGRSYREWRVVQVNDAYGGGEVPVDMPNEATARDRQRWLDEAFGNGVRVLRVETREVTPWESPDG